MTSNERTRDVWDPEEELDEKEASNLSDREFKVMIIRILNSKKKNIETKKGTVK